MIIDSLKEAQGLFPLDVVGFKADMLNYYGKFPLEEICLEWKAEMNDRYGGAMCALFLKVNPMGKGIVQESFTGDETIIASQNDLGTYYLNGMYTMRLTAYMLPDFGTVWIGQTMYCRYYPAFCAFCYWDWRFM